MSERSDVLFIKAYFLRTTFDIEEKELVDAIFHSDFDARVCPSEEPQPLTYILTLAGELSPLDLGSISKKPNVFYRTLSSQAW